MLSGEGKGVLKLMSDLPTTKDIDPVRAAFHLQRAQHAIGRCWSACLRAGHTDLADLANEVLHIQNRVAVLLPPPAPIPASDNAFDLSELAAVEAARPELERLVAVLTEALAVAEQIDAVRGRSFDEVIGGSAGWDIAEDVSQLRARVQLDLYGPGKRTLRPQG